MKRKVSLFSVALTTMLLTSLFTMNVFADQITEEKAKSIALDHAGVSSTDVSYIYTELDYEKGQQIYNVEFMTNTYDEYDYEILMENGTIVAADYEKKSRPLPGNKDNKEITIEQAKEFALKDADLKPEQVTFLKEKVDWNDGIKVYEVEFYTDMCIRDRFYTDTFQKYDYDIDAATGEVLAWDFDGDSAYARQDAVLRSQRKDTQKAATNDPLTLEDAKTTALKRANLNDSQVTWGPVYKEHDDGRLIFKGEFYYNTLEYEFEIDATTGRIVDWDVESIYD